VALTFDDLFASPDHYLHSFEGEAAVFVPMDRAAYRRSIFLDGRISPAGNGSMRLPLGAFAASIPPPAPTGWIFHVAHCGSTLLARALDRADANLVLREPLALRQVAVAPEDWRLALVAAMISKRYRADAPTIVKANVPVNFLLPRISARAPGARAIFLHLGLRDYLLAILRDENHRAWLRRVTAELAAFLAGIDELGDAERAASLWLAQMRAFAAAIENMPNARSLDAEAFFADPRHHLQLAAEHLEAAMPPEEIDALVEGPLFATYSKNPEVRFDNEARVARRREAERSMGKDLDLAQRWIDRHANAAGEAAAVVARVALG
jgi:hypothetical protein